MDGQGGRRGGGKHRKSEGGSEPTKANPGKGAAKIADTELSMRSWTDASSGDILVVLRAVEPAEGSIELAALSDGGVPEKDFTLPISEVIQVDGDRHNSLSFRGNVIDDVQIGEGLTTTLRIKLSSADRFRLGIA